MGRGHAYRARYFNPHPHVEGDNRPACQNKGEFYFNPHPHVEGDDDYLDAETVAANFNPHPHVEGDANESNSKHWIERFQSIPSRGG